MKGATERIGRCIKQSKYPPMAFPPFYRAFAQKFVASPRLHQAFHRALIERHALENEDPAVCAVDDATTDVANNFAG